MNSYDQLPLITIPKEPVCKKCGARIGYVKKCPICNTKRK